VICQRPSMKTKHESPGHYILLLVAYLLFSANVFADTASFSTCRLSEVELLQSHDSGEYYDPCLIRLFATDDFGLDTLFTFLRDKYTPQFSSPYRLLPRATDTLFIGIAPPDQAISFAAEELRDYANLGNTAILLTQQDSAASWLHELGVQYASSSSKTNPRPFSIDGKDWHYLNDDHTIIWSEYDKNGKIIIIGDSFAFANRRFNAGNKQIL